MAFLIQTNEGLKSAILPLGRALILIGRDPGSNLYLNDSSISKNHASIVFSDGAHILKDNGSTNGSIVNGTPVREHKLAHGDTIRFGPYSFTVDLVNPVPATTATGESGIALKRSGHSYSRSLRLPEIPGHEEGGGLQVVLSDKSKPAPPPLPPVGFLENLSEKERQNLSSRGVYHYARRGETLIQEGQDAGRLFFLIAGRLEARAGAAQTPLGRISPGEWVGEVNIFDPAGAVCSVVATEPSEYWEISREAFERFINESRGTGSAILIALAATLGRRIRQSTGALQKAVESPARRSKFTIPLAVAAVLAILAAAWFFLSGASDKTRLQAENRQIERESVQTLGEARQRIQSLQADLAAARSDLARALVENQSLATELESARSALVAKPTETPPPRSRAERPETPKPSRVETRLETASGHPSKIVVTTTTSVPALVDGKISGTVAIPAGRELPVVGVDGDSVLVEFANTPQKIPKAHTNFAEALAAEAEAAAAPMVASTPTPPPAPPAAKRSAAPEAPAEAPQTVETKDLEALIANARVLETLAELRPLRSATEQDAARAMRPIATKWNSVATEAARLLSTGSGSPAHIELLKKFLEASEMADPKRLQMFEAKLREIDSAWIKLKTGEKIQALTGGNPEADR
jgi:CRP/FNR family transcriptional regulator, cyclic AMP receptor protein